MQILPINLLKVISQNNQHKTSMQSVIVPTQSPDTFSKSPAFKGMESIKPFLEGKYKYTPENVKLFNKFLSELNLKDRTNNFLNEMIANAKNPGRFSSDPMYYTFNLDFLIKTLSKDELIDINLLQRFSFNCLPAVQFDEIDKSKVLAMIYKCCNKHNYFDYYETMNLHQKAIDNENIPLLNILFKDLKAYYVKILENEYTPFEGPRLELIMRGRHSNNSKVREFFTGENLYNFTSDYERPEGLLYYKDDEYKQVGLEIIEHTKPLSKKMTFINKYAEDAISHRYEFALSSLSSLPMSYPERKAILTNDKESPKYIYAAKIMNERFQKMVYRNAFDSPMNFLNCLKDSVMTEELLTYPFEGTTLIEEIANIKLDSNNKKIMSEILKELSKINLLKDNESYRTAALISAERGNIELLKFFDDRHVHFANSFTKPINEYPLEAQDILKSAKINDPKILEFQELQELEEYLQNHPEADINSFGPNQETLLDKVLAGNIEILKMLAKRDDFDWNMVNGVGDNFVIQLLRRTSDDENYEFAIQVLEILRELPEGKFDINYLNSDTALSLVAKNFHLRHNGLLDELLKFKDIDINYNPFGDVPLAFEIHHDIDSFRKIYLHPNTNRASIDIKAIVKALSAKNLIPSDEVMDIIENQVDYDFIDNVKKLYDKNGMLTLDEIEKLVNYENFSRFVDEKYNIVGENIGHFIAETFIEPNDIKSYKKLIKILEKLKASGYNFNSKDDLDETPLDKAIEGENEIVADLLRDYM